MYSVNGVPLDNDTFGWWMLRRSQPLTPVSKRLVSVEVPGRPGVLAGIPAPKTAASKTIVMRCSGENLEALYAVFEKNGGRGVLSLTDESTRATEFELTSIDPQGITPEDSLVNVAITMRIPSADWRETSITTTASTSVTDPIQEFDLFAGISSEIYDADIFVGGDFGNFELEDVGSGSWLRTIQTWPHVSNTGLLYVGATGQAFRAATATPWTPTADMSDYVDVSGGGFRISPTWVTDPSDRLATLELTTTAQSGVTFRVRGYNAFALRNGEV